MKKELEEKLIKAFPSMFRDAYGNPIYTCMAWGVDVGDGWFDLLWNLCNDIQSYLSKTDTNLLSEFKFEQIKEKFGTLRVYASSVDSTVYDLIDNAEGASAFICESCGTTNGVSISGSWLRTLCDACRQRGNKH